MKTLLHVNYHEGPGKLDELFKLAKINGYNGVELRWKYRFSDMTQDQYQEKIAQLKNDCPEMEIVFGGAVDFCRGEADVVRRDTESYLEFLDWSKRHCGTRVMNFFTGGMVCPGIDYSEFHCHGSNLAQESDYERAAAGLKIVGDRAAANQMLIALETHNCYLHDLIAPCRKLMDMTAHDAVGVNYDQGNIILNKNGSSIADFFEKLGDKLYYAHLKNMLVFQHKVYMSTRLEEGYIDTMAVMAGLKTHLRSGMIATEYPNSGDGVIAARRDMEYIRYIKEWLQID